MFAARYERGPVPQFSRRGGDDLKIAGNGVVGMALGQAAGDEVAADAADHLLWSAAAQKHG